MHACEYNAFVILMLIPYLPGSISRINPSWWATLSFQLLVLLAAVSNFFLTSWNKTQPHLKNENNLIVFIQK